MQFSPNILAVRLLLMAGCAAGAGWCSTGSAAVVVLVNRTGQSVALEVRATGGPSGNVTLPPGRLIPIHSVGGVEIAFGASQKRRRVDLELNSLYHLVAKDSRIELQKVVFSHGGAGLWLHVQSSGKLPPPVVVPVKILVDEEQPALGKVWESELRRQIESASRIFERYCRVRFEVVASGTWNSDNTLKDFRKLGEEFAREVSPDPARVAIGVTSQFNIDSPHRVPHSALEPLYSHLLLPAAQKHLSADDQLALLVHDLGHFLGAVPMVNDGSLMGLKFPRGISKLRQHGIAFDPVNTLLMNLVAEEIRVRKVRGLGDMPRSARRYLHAIYSQVALDRRGEAARFAALVRDATPKQARYTGLWTDGTQVTADAVESWHDTSSRPRLAGRALFDENHPIRWLVDNTAAGTGQPPARIEMFGGDCLPGRVVEFRDGIESESLGLPPHLLVNTPLSFDWPDGPVRANLQVPIRWVRRIVWRQETDHYRPGTLIFRGGGRLEFRSLRPGRNGIRFLLADGVREIAVRELAEVHLPRADPWEIWFAQLAVLAPEGRARLMRLETVSGLRITGSTGRFQARSRGSDSDPNNWYHLIQPAWCLQPLWLAHRDVRLRCYFSAQEVPLSHIAPAARRQQSALGGVWPARADRNAEGERLASGPRRYHWGWGVHAMSELEFALPACARAFRTQLGLDRLAGAGGCVTASVFLGPTTGKPLYAGPIVVGSTDVLDTGPLELDLSAHRAGPLVLRVDPVGQQRPRGADPFDVRDHFDWLEPLVELDPKGLQAETARQVPTLIPAWRDWTVNTDRANGPLLLSDWGRHGDSRDSAYRSLVRLPEGSLRLSRKLLVAAGNDRLLLAVRRPRQSTPSKIEVRLDGQSTAEFEVPPEGAAGGPEPLEVSLGDFRQREITLEIIQQSPDDRALVQWRAITLTGAATGSEEAGQ